MEFADIRECFLESIHNGVKKSSGRFSPFYKKDKTLAKCHVLLVQATNKLPVFVNPFGNAELSYPDSRQIRRTRLRASLASSLVRTSAQVGKVVVGSIIFLFIRGY